MSLKALDVGGHVSLIGASLSQSGAGLDPLLLSGRGTTLGSISVGSRADFETMKPGDRDASPAPRDRTRHFRSPRLTGISRDAALGRSLSRMG
jgi:hypothetical protein